MAKRRMSSESYESGQKRKAQERAMRGFVYRTRPGRYGESAGGSRLGAGAAREQSGRDRFKKGHFGAKRKK